MDSYSPRGGGGGGAAAAAAVSGGGVGRGCVSGRMDKTHVHTNTHTHLITHPPYK